MGILGTIISGILVFWLTIGLHNSNSTGQLQTKIYTPELDNIRYPSNDDKWIELVKLNIQQVNSLRVSTVEIASRETDWSDIVTQEVGKLLFETRKTASNGLRESKEYYVSNKLKNVKLKYELAMKYLIMATDAQLLEKNYPAAEKLEKQYFEMIDLVQKDIGN